MSYLGPDIQKPIEGAQPIKLGAAWIRAISGDEQTPDKADPRVEAPRFEPEEDYHRSVLEAYTGFRQVAMGRNRDDDEEEKKAKEERKQSEDARSFLQDLSDNMLSYGGMTFSRSTVINNLSAGLAQQKAFLEKDIPELSKDDLLFVDQNGRRVSADTPGARQVTTQEEKLKLEERDKMCIMGVADVTLDENGKMVRTEDYVLRMAIEERTAETEKVIKDLQAGKIKLEDLPESMKQQVKDIQEDGKLNATAEPVGGGVLGILNRDMEQKKIVSEYLERNPEMKPSMPAPSAPSM